jgi:hypothetical protein
MKYSNFIGQIGLFFGGMYMILFGYNQIYLKNTGSTYNLSYLTQNSGITNPNSYGAYVGEILLGIILTIFAILWFYKNLKLKK